MDLRLSHLLLICCLASSRPVLSALDVGMVSEVINGVPAGASTPITSPSSPLFFVFGASLVDSGTNAFAMPYRSGAEFEPYGSDYFGRPVGRWSNGRTFMDIITQSLGFGLLDPFIKSVGADYTHGVNFASSGSTAVNTSSTATNSGGLFSLLVQVEQYREYQRMLLSSQRGLIAKARLRKQLSSSIYFFEIGDNDYVSVDLDNNPIEVVKVVIAHMRQAFEVLYSLGARTFIVTNVVPFGCLPTKLTSNATLRRDDRNCIIAWNAVARMHNQQLAQLLSILRSTHPLAQWILFDAYSIFLDGFRNPSNYGILDPFQVCCGSGGPYNLNLEVVCGEAPKYINGTYIEATKCRDPSLHLIWDFIHPTESFASYIARGVLHSTHLTPHFNITVRAHTLEDNPLLQQIYI